LGEAYLYQVTCALSKNNSPIDNIKTHFGIRTIEVARDKDTSGISFYVKLNGQFVFMKGANYIPPDNFMPRVSAVKYEKIIDNAVDAHMNMVRVWGGGNYEDDRFYDLCDKKGILVWQDFMFACGMVPGDTSFQGNVKQEVVQNVRRLRNHPCLALWCGNNEIAEGWANWGWQKQIKPADTAKIYSAYSKLFNDIIPAAIIENDPGRFYWPSSPMPAHGGQDNLKDGDWHYWGVWANNQPFLSYEKKIGRFMSEFGFQSWPNMKMIEQFTLPEDRQLGSAALKAHQKHPKGDEIIQTYFEKEYQEPRDFESYTILSQILQADAVAKAIEIHRRSAPYCGGSLYWQLNDCWPAVSWSSTDYNGDWKALHYKVKRANEPFLVSIEEKDNKGYIYIVNETGAPIEGTMIVGLREVIGNDIWTNFMPFNVKAGFCGFFTEVSLDILNSMHNRSLAMLWVQIKKGTDLVASKTHYFSQMRNLNFPRPYLLTDTKAATDGFDITIQSDKFAKDIFVRLKEGEGFFDDNFFDLGGSETKKVHCKTRLDKETFDKALEIRTIVDCY
jgi:beta-mannosidase